MPQAIRDKGPIPVHVTAEEHKKGWRKQKERTACEPSGLSFSHFQAATYDDVLNEMDATLRSLPLEIGYIPEAWEVITDVEILKKAQVFEVDKMRLIQLMLAEMNMDNKTIGRRMLQNAEEAGTVAEEQDGSRKDRRAILTCLNKVLLAGLFWQLKLAGAFCMNDAKSCYDRIVHPVAALAMRRQGVPKQVTTVLLGALQRARHSISTGYGITSNVYGGPNQIPPLQGAGQGNGKAPALWALISTVLINMMRRAGHGVQLLTSISMAAISLVCFAFVDDTDTVQSGHHIHSTGEEVLQEFQPAVDRWEGGLRATGGAIVPEKSFWYLLDYKWDGHHFKYRTQTDMPGQLTVRDQHGHRIPLRRHEPHHAEKTLGVFVALDGNQEAEYDYLLEHSKTFADQLKPQRIARNNAMYAFQASFLKTIEYPMIATMLTEKDWRGIMRPALEISLRKAGMASTFPRAVLYGPELYQGIWNQTSLLPPGDTAHHDIGSRIELSIPNRKTSPGIC